MLKLSSLFKKIVTEDEVLALVHLFLLRSCCVCAPLGFVTKYLLDLHHWNELKNFAANNLLSWSLKSRTGIAQLVSHVLGSRASKGKLSLQNKSNWVLG